MRSIRLIHHTDSKPFQNSIRLIHHHQQLLLLLLLVIQFFSPPTSPAQNLHLIKACVLFCLNKNKTQSSSSSSSSSFLCLKASFLDKEIFFPNVSIVKIGANETIYSLTLILCHHMIDTQTKYIYSIYYCDSLTSRRNTTRRESLCTSAFFSTCKI